MPLTQWIGLALAMVMVTAPKIEPPPVVLDLGPVVPTPAPTPHGAEHKRLITTITVQNSVDGETVVSFEASDVAVERNGKTHTIASKTYSLAEVKPELQGSRDKMVQQLRDLERDMLNFVEKAGPPKARAPIQPSEGGGR
jgi:hypothetical protein